MIDRKLDVIVIVIGYIRFKAELYVKITQGKMYLTQGKLRENTGNFISAGMWPPGHSFVPRL